jgi:hypothetical protein
MTTRPTIKKGSTGSQVTLVQDLLQALPIDGDFGSITDKAVKDFQFKQRLSADGIVGKNTWAALDKVYGPLPPYPEGLPPVLDGPMLTKITQIAVSSSIAKYYWKDRGKAPTGYTKGFAVAWSTVYRKWLMKDSCVIEMAIANTGNSDKDVLAWYFDEYRALSMDNSQEGGATLRHLFALMMGLGMRESGGKYCTGRDTSASNTSSDTAEAGLYQMSWNARSCSWAMQSLMDTYSPADKSPICARNFFAENVTCSSADWASYGSGAGYAYQELAKSCPQFATETAAIGLRNLRQHWGPINRKEAELRQDADDMLLEIQNLFDITG